MLHRGCSDSDSIARIDYLHGKDSGEDLLMVSHIDLLAILHPEALQAKLVQSRISDCTGLVEAFT